LQKVQPFSESIGRSETPILYLNPVMQKLIVCGNNIVSLEHSNEILLKNEQTTHADKILSVVYNKLFNVIVSSDAGSTINVWDLSTG
jgi:hypothetical protein